MSKQNKNYKLKEYQKTILDLEKKYMSYLLDILLSDEFQNDLLAVGDEIRDRYNDYKNIWNLKNKIKTPAERLVYHHIYMNTEKNFNINKLYTSAVSSDIGIIVNNEVVLCVDVKTNDLSGNKSDVNKIIVEKNQNSFDNKNYNKLQNIKSNLDTRMRYKPNYPILTYIIKINYIDDTFVFNLIRNNKEYPTIQLSCIPNGDLSDLFGYNIINGVKTYNYNFLSDTTLVFKTLDERNKYIEDNKELYIIKEQKGAYSTNGIILWEVKKNKKYYLVEGKTPSTIRLNKESIENRFDSEGKSWSGTESIYL